MTRQDSIDWLSFVCNLWVAHIKAPRRTNEHEVLGELYHSQFEFVDALTELAIARDGDTKFPQTDILIHDGISAQQLLKSGLAVVQAIREGLDSEADSDMANRLDDAKADIMRAAYKLELVLGGKR